MWEFFNEYPHVAGFTQKEAVALHAGGDLGGGRGYFREMIDLFIEALKAGRKVIDIGCGAGMPGLFVAPHVDELVGIDPAPRMLAEARENAARLGVENIVFMEASADDLPFADGTFDGAALCGLLESMDERKTDEVMVETRRVLSPGARIAVAVVDWGEDRQQSADRKVRVWHGEGRLMFVVVEATESPYVVKHTRYVVDPDSPTGRKLTGGLPNDNPASTTLGPDDLAPGDILDAWHGERVGFTRDTLTSLVASHGFGDIDTRDLQGEIFLTASKTGKSPSGR